MRYIQLFTFLFIINSGSTYAQNMTVEGTEVGVDLAFSASTFGGNAGIGLKYGVNLGEYLIVGPSGRYERTWVKNATTGFNGGYNVFGGGVFAHARFFNALFVGAEFEMLKSPFTREGFLTAQGTWAPTLFLGGGFSMEFNESFRINAGIMYDVLDRPNSPFSRSYFMKKKTADGSPAGYLPVIYRIAFFFPLS